MIGKILFFIIIITLLFLAIFEVGILAVAFIGADKVECNLLWCTFTTERNNKIIKTTSEIYSECFVNGIKTNCSEWN